jgi:hypothetical protein
MTSLPSLPNPETKQAAMPEETHLCQMVRHSL